MDRTREIEQILDGTAGLGWIVSADRARTRAALAEVLASMPEPQFLGMFAGSLHVQVSAPPCRATFFVAFAGITVSPADGQEKAAAVCAPVQAHVEFVYFAAVLEWMDDADVRTAVRQGLTVALERLAGRTTQQAMQIAGITGNAPDGGAGQPN